MYTSVVLIGDSWLLHHVNSGPEWLAPLFWFLSEATNLPGGKIALGLAVLALVVQGPLGRVALGSALIAFLLANEITDVFKQALPMPRPFQVEEVILRVGGSDSMGTASAHSANMMAVAVSIWLRLGPGWGVPWIVVAILTGYSRAFNGVHYPSQVVLGWACGVFGAFLVYKTWDAFVLQRQRGHRSKEEHGEGAA